MSDSILNIIINTVKRGGGDKEAINNLVKMKNQFKEITGINLSSVTAWAMVGAAVGKLADFTQKAIDKTVVLAEETEKLMVVTGESAEATSRMKEAADDLRVGYDDLYKSLGFASKQGIDVSTESLIKMADTFVSLKPGVQQSTWLVENFGKQGRVMAKMFAEGGAGVVTALKNVDSALIITDKAIKQAKEYRIAQDNMADAGLKFSVAWATNVIPIWTEFLTDLAKFPDWFSEQKPDKLLGSLGVAGGMSADQIARLKTQMAGMVTPAGEAEAALGALKNQLGEEGGLGDELPKVTTFFKELTKEMIFNQIAAHLDYESALALARSMGLINENTYRAASGIDKMTASFDTNANGMIEPIEMTKEYWEWINKVTSTAGTYAWNFVVNSSAPGFNLGPGSYQEALQQGLINGSSGGLSGGSGWVLKGTKGGPGTEKAWSNGSQWYYGDKPPGAATGGLVKVGERGTEIVKLPDGAFVYNHQQTQQMLGGGGQTTNIFNISGAGDPKRVADEVVRRLNIQSVGRFK